MTASFHVNEWVVSGFCFPFKANLCLVDLVETNYSAKKVIADLFISTEGTLVQPTDGVFSLVIMPEE